MRFFSEQIDVIVAIDNAYCKIPGGGGIYPGQNTSIELLWFSDIQYQVLTLVEILDRIL